MNIKKEQLKGIIVVAIAWLFALSLLFLTLVKLKIFSAI
jgi:hypothetical protein